MALDQKKISQLDVRNTVVPGVPLPQDGDLMEVAVSGVGSYQASLSTLKTYFFTNPQVTGTLTTPKIQVGAANWAVVGQILLPNNNVISWRNAANSADFTMRVNGSDLFQFDVGATFSGNVSATGITHTFGPGGVDVNTVNFIINSGNGGNARPTLVWAKNSAIVFLMGSAGSAGDLVTGSATGDTVWRSSNNPIIISADNGTTKTIAIAVTNTVTFAAGVVPAVDNTQALGGPAARWVRIYTDEVRAVGASFSVVNSGGAGLFSGNTATFLMTFTGGVTTGDSLTVGGAGILSFTGGGAQSTTGHIRLPNNVFIGWRNAGNTGNVTLGLDNANQLVWSGGVTFTGAGGMTLSSTLGVTNQVRSLTGDLDLDSNGANAVRINRSGGTGGFTVFAGGTITSNLTVTDAGDMTLRSTLAVGPNPATSGAIRVGNNVAISARNAANSANVQLIYADGSDHVIVGGDPKIVGIGTPGSFAGAAVGDVVLANGKAIDSTNNAGSGVLALIFGNASDQVVLGNGNDIKWGKANVALGGGAAPTLGTIGGSGPAAAAQRNWLRFVESDGAVSFIPVWR